MACVAYPVSRSVVSENFSYVSGPRIMLKKKHSRYSFLELGNLPRQFLFNGDTLCTRPRREYIPKAETKNSNVGDVRSPLELQSSAGRLLDGILHSQPHKFIVAAERQLEELSVGHKNAVAYRLSLTDLSSILHRKIAEMRIEECGVAVQEVLYMLVVQKFASVDILMTPALVTCTESGKTGSWISAEKKLQSIHSPETLELIKEYLPRAFDWKDGLNIQNSNKIAEIGVPNLGIIYVASILYGYFLKNAYQRYQLEMMLQIKKPGFIDMYTVRKRRVASRMEFPSEEASMKDIKPDEPCISFWGEGEGTPRKLRDYMKSFNKEALKTCATIRTKEAGTIIEKHSESLFGRTTIDGTAIIENKNIARLEFASLKRLLLEGIAFGSFLWDVEGYVDSTYSLTDNSDSPD